MNKLRDSIAKLEAQTLAAATPEAAKPPPAAKPASTPAASARAPSAAARKPPTSTTEASPAKRKVRSCDLHQCKSLSVEKQWVQ